MTKNNEPEHGSLVSRSSIDSRFQWNINDIYPDQESWKTASQQFKKDVDAFSQYKGQLHDCQTLKNNDVVFGIGLAGTGKTFHNYQ